MAKLGFESMILHMLFLLSQAMILSSCAQQKCPQGFMLTLPTKMSPIFHVNLNHSRDLLFNSPKLTRKGMHLKWPLISPVYNTFLLSVLYVLGTHTGNTLSLICACSIYVYESLCKYLYVWQFSTKLSCRMQGNGFTDQHSTNRIGWEGGLGHTGLSWLIFDLKNVGLLCALLCLFTAHIVLCFNDQLIILLILVT